jgi:hypothetical protein
MRLVTKCRKLDLTDLPLGLDPESGTGSTLLTSTSKGTTRMDFEQSIAGLFQGVDPATPLAFGLVMFAGLIMGLT